MEDINFQEKYLELDEQNKNLTLNIKTLNDENNTLKEENKKLREWNNKLALKIGFKNEEKDEEKDESVLSNEQIIKRIKENF